VSVKITTCRSARDSVGFLLFAIERGARSIVRASSSKKWLRVGPIRIPTPFPASCARTLLEKEKAMITLYDFDESPNCLKIKILLKELGVAYREQRMTRAALRGPAYREKFPTGMSPAIEDGDIRISDSGAIALYLGSKHGQLIPADPARRALMFQAILVEASLLAPTVGGQGLFGELYKPEAERNAARKSTSISETQPPPPSR
jgi:glutathione S-transferase-like protein